MSLTYCAFFLEAFLAAFSAFFEAFFIMMSCFTALIFLRATGGIFFRVSLSSGVTLMQEQEQEQEQEQVLQSGFFLFLFLFLFLWNLFPYYNTGFQSPTHREPSETAVRLHKLLRWFPTHVVRQHPGNLKISDFYFRKRH